MDRPVVASPIMASLSEKKQLGQAKTADQPFQHSEAVVDVLGQEAYQDAVHVDLSWRSWLVVLIACFGVAGQVFVVVAATSVLAFIVRDLGHAELKGWVVEGPLLMQSAFSPLVGRLSDILGRKYLAAVPPLIALVGAVVSAKATTIETLLGASFLIGTTLSTAGILGAMPSEVLPLKYRPIAQGLFGIGATAGGLVGSLAAGAVTDQDIGGWRWVFWIQVVFHASTFLGLMFFYWPPHKQSEVRARDVFWACDPIGTLLFVSGSSLTLLAFNWTASYPWSDAHVVVSLALGLSLLAGFCVYEWKGREDGLVPHVFFQRNANFGLALLAIAAEGYIFYGAVNFITPQLALNLDFEDSAYDIALHLMPFSLAVMVAAFLTSIYATRFQDLKSPLVVGFALFLVGSVAYATVSPTWTPSAQVGVNVLCGLGQAAPLVILPSVLQYASVHAHLSLATGLLATVRGIFGAFAVAVLGAIVNGRLASSLAPAVSTAAVAAGLPPDQVPALLGALESGAPPGLVNVDGATDSVWAAAMKAWNWEFATAYRLAWASVVPIGVLAVGAVFCLKSVKDLMTEKVEATVEHVSGDEEGA